MMMIIISGHFRIFYPKDGKKTYFEEKHYKQEILITKRTLRLIPPPHPSPLSLSYLATPMRFLNPSLSLLI